jgi:AcrR family transcriptional regulator
MVRKSKGELNNGRIKVSTKQKILENAVSLFAIKGYTETSIRELARIVGVKEASIYNHFPSKNAILECILEEYRIHIAEDFFMRDKLSELKKNPTADGILSCMTLAFPEDRAEYYLKLLYVILQEQYRNPAVRKFMSDHVILSAEQVIGVIIDKLKEFNIIQPDTNPDFWAQMHSSVVYAFASRMLLGLDSTNMVELLRDLYGMMLKTCGAQSNESTELVEESSA